MRQRLVVSEEVELTPLQKEMEVTNSRVGSQKFSVEDRVFGLGGGEFPGGAMKFLRELEASMAREMAAPGSG